MLAAIYSDNAGKRKPSTVENTHVFARDWQDLMEP